MTPEEKRILLAEQHRNTRHDAVEKVLNIISKYGEVSVWPPYVDAMLNEITGAIMNLKQREP